MSSYVQMNEDDQFSQVSDDYLALCFLQGKVGACRHLFKREKEKITQILNQLADYFNDRSRWFEEDSIIVSCSLPSVKRRNSFMEWLRKYISLSDKLAANSSQRIAFSPYMPPAIWINESFN